MTTMMTAWMLRMRTMMMRTTMTIMTMIMMAMMTVIHEDSDDGHT